MSALLIALCGCVLFLAHFADAGSYSSYYSSSRYYYYHSSYYYYYHSSSAAAVGLALWIRIVIGVVVTLVVLGVGLFVLIYMCCCEKKRNNRRRVQPNNNSTNVFTVSNGTGAYPQQSTTVGAPGAMVYPPPYTAQKPPAYTDQSYPLQPYPPPSDQTTPYPPPPPTH